MNSSWSEAACSVLETQWSVNHIKEPGFVKSFLTGIPNHQRKVMNRWKNGEITQRKHLVTMELPIVLHPAVMMKQVRREQQRREPWKIVRDVTRKKESVEQVKTVCKDGRQGTQSTQIWSRLFFTIPASHQAASLVNSFTAVLPSLIIPNTSDIWQKKQTSYCFWWEICLS